jgi:hypothetical protein
MPSQSRDTRENQRKSYDQRIQERRAVLEKKGISPKEFNKDRVYEHLKAKRRDIMKAIAAMDERSARDEQRKQAAAEQAAPAPVVAPAPAVAKEKKPKKEKQEKAGKAAPAKAGD